MHANPDSHPAPGGRAAWLARPLPFLLAIALLLLGAALAPAAVAGAPAGPVSQAAPPFEEEGECEEDPFCEEAFEGEECEAFEAEEEECEEEEGAGPAKGEAPAECLLTSARPRISISGPRRRLRLAVRYTLAGPAEVVVSLRSSGGGPVSVAPSRHRLSHSGSLHETAALSEEETERALAAKRFTVRLRVLGVPWSCRRYDVRHLDVRRGGEEARSFSERAADLRAGR